MKTIAVPNNLVNKCIRAVIVGAGHRSLLYASYALQHPEQLQIVGVVDPNQIRRTKAAKIHNIPPENCFESIEMFVRHPRFADAVINGTMDNLHVETTLPLLAASYDVLLEKPIGINRNEVLRLLDAARNGKKTVMICHVLRYAPFYAAIRKRIVKGAIGDIISICTQENVSYHHMAVAFIRGKWNNRQVSQSTFLMAKSCHDLDLITWMKSGIKPITVSSFGNLTYFKPEKAPIGAGMRCLLDCNIESACPFSAYKNYIEQNLWPQYVWIADEYYDRTLSVEQKVAALKTQNPFGRCVWHCDNDVMDHQMVNIEFSDGCIANHCLTSNASKPCRYIHIIGTKGEIEGVLEDGSFTVRYPDARKGHEYAEEKINVSVTDDMHGGGDLLLVEDFVKVVKGEAPSISTTTLEDSINGHLIGFAANDSNDQRKVITM